LNRFQLPQGGEEYKNQLLYGYLRKQYATEVVDTHLWKKKPFVVLNLLRKLFFKKWDKIIISASSKSVYHLLSFLRFFPFIASKSTYFVIGGYFPTALMKGEYKMKPYESLKSIVVEGFLLEKKLKEAGYKGNVYVIPNFKQFPRIFIDSNKEDVKTKFLFLSRIHPDKGIAEIVEAIRMLKEWGFENFSTTFFGPIDKKYKKNFENLLGNNINYGGVIDIMNDTEKSYKILSIYDVMLFPTYWNGEGFPGVLVDAFVAGLPVIASDWNMNREIIENGNNGLLIPAKSALDLALAMKKIIENPNLKRNLSIKASECAIKYHINTVGPMIDSLIVSNK